MSSKVDLFRYTPIPFPTLQDTPFLGGRQWTVMAVVATHSLRCAQTKKIENIPRLAL